MRIGKLKFCELFIRLDGQPIRFLGRPYLADIYASRARRLVLRTSRQVEKSTFLATSILFELATRPGIRILLVCPRQEQASVFVHTRLLPILEQSPFVRRALLGRSPKKLPVSNMRFINQSQLHVRAAYHSADSARGISADLLIIDEFQDVCAGSLPILQETLSHSQWGRTMLTGTPKMIENHLEGVYAQSTAYEWTIACSRCNAGVILDERCLGPTSITCPQCQQPLQAGSGRWIARHPDATWGDGFWFNHLMVPWLNYQEVLDRQGVYDLAQFKNEVLGLSTTLGEHVVSRAELERCCCDRPMAHSLADIPDARHGHLIAGIDWGGGRKSRTVVVVGYVRPDRVFEVIHLQRFRADEDPNRLLRAVADLLGEFGVRWIGADGAGHGIWANRQLLDELSHQADLYGIIYSAADHAPHQENVLWQWTVNRTVSIGLVYTLVKKGRIVFPRVADSGSFLDEMACELAEYDEKQRSVRYTHPDNQQDDALHAMNYALLMANRWLQCIGSQLFAENEW